MERKLFLAAFLAASLLSGCGGSGGNSSGSGEKGGAKSTATAKATFPAREATTTAPVATFKIGDREGKVYELTNFDDKTRASQSSLAVMGKSIYYHGKAEGAETLMWGTWEAAAGVPAAAPFS